MLKIGRMWSRLTWAKKQDPISKITRTKRIRGGAQAVEHLSSKHEVFSLNPSTITKKNSQA
jgi:hypothetical protein